MPTTVELKVRLTKQCLVVLPSMGWFHLVYQRKLWEIFFLEEELEELIVRITMASEELIGRETEPEINKTQFQDIESRSEEVSGSRDD